MIKLKRAYDPVKKDDGCRILVDRLWPRGVSKEELSLDHWLKDLAPTDELRQWFDHDPERFEEFRHRYKKELDKNKQLDELRSLCAKEKKVTLIYAAKDRNHNNAVVLKEYLEQQLS